MTEKIVVIAICLCLWFNASGQPNPSLPSHILNDEEIWAIYNHLCQDLKLTMTIEGVEGYPTAGYLNTKEYQLDNRWAAEIGGPIRMYLDVETGKVLMLWNSIMIRKLCSDESRKELKKPCMTKEEVLRQAEQYLQKIGCPEIQQCVLKKIVFSENSGTWRFVWTRKYGEYFFGVEGSLWHEGIILEIHEQYGLYSYSNHCCSELPPTLEVKISQDRAKELAFQYTELVFRWLMQKELDGARQAGVEIPKDYGDDFLNELAEMAIQSQELGIINPNYWCTNQQLEIKRNPKSRLAWVFVLRIHYKELAIWVDAATGEYLGGAGKW